MTPATATSPTRKRRQKAQPASAPPPPSFEACWNLRMAAAERGVWTGVEFRRLLWEKAGLRLSAASVSALLTKQPSLIRLETLAACCAALSGIPGSPDCTPNDLITVSQ